MPRAVDEAALAHFIKVPLTSMVRGAGDRTNARPTGSASARQTRAADRPAGRARSGGRGEHGVAALRRGFAIGARRRLPQLERQARGVEAPAAAATPTAPSTAPPPAAIGLLAARAAVSGLKSRWRRPRGRHRRGIVRRHAGRAGVARARTSASAADGGGGRWRRGRPPTSPSGGGARASSRIWCGCSSVTPPPSPRGTTRTAGTAASRPSHTSAQATAPAARDDFLLGPTCAGVPWAEEGARCTPRRGSPTRRWPRSTTTTSSNSPAKTAAAATGAVAAGGRHGGHDRRRRGAKRINARGGMAARAIAPSLAEAPMHAALSLRARPPPPPPRRAVPPAARGAVAGKTRCRALPVSSRPRPSPSTRLRPATAAHCDGHAAAPAATTAAARGAPLRPGAPALLAGRARRAGLLRQPLRSGARRERRHRADDDAG